MSQLAMTFQTILEFLEQLFDLIAEFVLLLRGGEES